MDWTKIPGDHYALVEDGDVLATFPTAKDADKAAENSVHWQWAKTIRVDQLVDWQLANNDEPDFDDEHDMFRDDVEADADALASAGFGTDEDYGFFGEEDY